MTNQIYVTLNDDGFPVGFWQSKAYEEGAEPPQDAMLITEEQFADVFGNQGARRWDGARFVQYTPPAAPVSAAAVIAERSRRLSAGFEYDFGDARGVHRIGTTDADQIGWSEVTTLSNALLAIGERTAKITAVTGTGPVEITPLEWQSVLVAAGEFRQPIWGASFLLQAMNPIPEDFADDRYWP